MLLKICNNKDIKKDFEYKKLLMSYDTEKLKDMKKELNKLEKNNKITFIQFLYVNSILTDTINIKK